MSLLASVSDGSLLATKFAEAVAALFQRLRALPELRKVSKTIPAAKEDPRRCQPVSAFNGLTHVVGHRGASHDAPENTAASMRLALEKGANGIEFDIQLSKDGEIFVLHDSTLRRTACAAGEGELRKLGIDQPAFESMLDFDVSALEYRDFARHVDVGSHKSRAFAGEKPPLMTEVMDLVPEGCFALCEIKGGDHAIVDAVVSLVEKHRWPADRLRFIGFDFELMVRLKDRLKDTGFGDIKVIFLQDAYTAQKALEVVRRVEEQGLDGVDFEANVSVVTAEVVAAARRARLQIGVWVWSDLPDSDTVGTIAAMQDLGIDFFTTDLPPQICAWMEMPAKPLEVH